MKKTDVPDVLGGKETWTAEALAKELINRLYSGHVDRLTEDTASRLAAQLTRLGFAGLLDSAAKAGK